MTGLYDIHCHFLPGVDDGAESMEQAMRLLEMEFASGVRHVVLTPHFRLGMFETDRDRIDRVFTDLRAEAAEKLPELRLTLGSEFHANLDMCAMLRDDARYLIGDTPCLLTEFSSLDGKKYIQSRLYELRAEGIIPIVAHMERYPALCGDFALIRSLQKLGVRFQINADSVLGRDGFHLKRLCMKLLWNGLAELIASDAHDERDRLPRLGLCAEYLEKKLGFEETQRLFVYNPQELMQHRRTNNG